MYVKFLFSWHSFRSPATSQHCNPFVSTWDVVFVEIRYDRWPCGSNQIIARSFSLLSYQPHRELFFHCDSHVCLMEPWQSTAISQTNAIAKNAWLTVNPRFALTLLARLFRWLFSLLDVLWMITALFAERCLLTRHNITLSIDSFEKGRFAHIHSCWSSNRAYHHRNPTLSHSLQLLFVDDVIFCMMLARIPP
jgi:hypothetical protein